MQDAIKLRRVFEVVLILFAIAVFHYSFAARSNYWLLIFCLLVVVYSGWTKSFSGILSRKRIWIPLVLLGTLLGRYIADVSTLNQWTIESDSWGEFRVVSNRMSSLFPVYVTFAGRSHWVWNNFHDIDVIIPEGGVQEIEVKIALFPMQRVITGKVLSRGDTGAIDNTFSKKGTLYLKDTAITGVYGGSVRSGTNSIWVIRNNEIRQINILSGATKTTSFSGPPQVLYLSDYGYTVFVKPNKIFRDNNTSEIVDGVLGVVPGYLFGNDWRLHTGFTPPWNDYRYWDKLRPNEKILDANSYEYEKEVLKGDLSFVRLVQLNGNLELVWEDEMKNTSKVFKPKAAILNKNSRVYLNSTTLFLTNQENNGLIINTIQLDQSAGVVQTTSTVLNGFQLLSAKTRVGQLVVTGIENGVGKIYFLDDKGNTKSSSSLSESVPFSVAVDYTDRIIVAWKSKSGTVIRRYW